MPDYSITLAMKVRLNTRNISTARRAIRHLIETGFLRLPSVAGAENWGSWAIRPTGKPRITRFERTWASARDHRTKRKARTEVLV